MWTSTSNGAGPRLGPLWVAPSLPPSSTQAVFVHSHRIGQICSQPGLVDMDSVSGPGASNTNHIHQPGQGTKTGQTGGNGQLSLSYKDPGGKTTSLQRRSGDRAGRSAGRAAGSGGRAGWLAGGPSHKIQVSNVWSRWLHSGTATWATLVISGGSESRNPNAGCLHPDSMHKPQRSFGSHF
jgi:hypothetical protein